MLYELVVDGVVINRVLADAAFMAQHYPQGGYRLAAEQPPTETPEQRHISVGAFFDRFGGAKWAILSSPDPLVQALIRDVSVRRYIDLSRPDLLQGLMLVQSKGFDIDPGVIVDAPVQPSERA